MTQQRVDGPTPHGGDYALLTFFDQERKVLPSKRGAMYVDVEEWTSSGRRLAKTYMTVGNPPATGPTGVDLDVPADDGDDWAKATWDLMWVDEGDQWRPVETLAQLFVTAPYRNADSDEARAEELGLLIASSAWQAAPEPLRSEAYAWMDRHREAATAS